MEPQFHGIHGRRVTLYDTTLRDGEQSPGLAFTPAQKLEIAHLLDEARVPQIEVGFPPVSASERRACRLVARAGLDADILVLSRLKREDIEMAAAVDADMVLLFIATSPIHLRHKLRMKEDGVLAAIEEGLDTARAHGLKASFTPEDATRTPLPFLRKAISTAVKVGAARIGIADTLGCATPDAIARLTRALLVGGRSFSLHLHNDFGLATANALAGVAAGADSVAVTVLGIGERTGNVPLEQAACALEFLCGARTGIRHERLTPLAERVARIARVPVPRHAPLVGPNAFAHESGIHAAAVLAHPPTYEAVPPEAVGNRRRILFGKHSGRGAVEGYLVQSGVGTGERLVGEVLKHLKGRGGAPLDGDGLVALARRLVR